MGRFPSEAHKARAIKIELELESAPTGTYCRKSMV